MTSLTTETSRVSSAKHDPLIEGVPGHLGEKLFSHSKVLFWAVGALVLVAAAAAFMVERGSRASEQAQGELFLARQTLDKELAEIAGRNKDGVNTNTKTKTPPAKALGAEAFEYMAFDVDAKLPEALKKLKAVAEKHGTTRAGFEARLTIGNLYLNHGHPEKAVSWFNSASEAAPDTSEKAFSWAAAGYAHESAGKWAEAILSYEKALNFGVAGIRGEVLLGLARSYEAEKDVAKARATYDRVLSEMAGTSAAKIAERSKAKLGQ